MLFITFYSKLCYSFLFFEIWNFPFHFWIGSKSRKGRKKQMRKIIRINTVIIREISLMQKLRKQKNQKKSKKKKLKKLKKNKKKRFFFWQKLHGLKIAFFLWEGKSYCKIMEVFSFVFLSFFFSFFHFCFSFFHYFSSHFGVYFTREQWYDSSLVYDSHRIITISAWREEGEWPICSSTFFALVLSIDAFLLTLVYQYFTRCYQFSLIFVFQKSCQNE